MRAKGFVVLVSCALVACGSSGSGSADARWQPNSDAVPDATTTIIVEPADMQTLQVVIGQTPPTLGFTATRAGEPVAVSWTVDRTNVGSIDSAPTASATLTPTGNLGGFVTVTATLGVDVAVVER